MPDEMGPCSHSVTCICDVCVQIHPERLVPYGDYGCQECEQLRLRLAKAERVIAARQKIAEAQEANRNSLSSVTIRDGLRTIEDANIEYARALADWERENG